MTVRRAVRVTEQFFARLDTLLPPERSADGGPSATDFLLHEMPAVIEQLATGFEATTVPTPSQPEVRALIAAGLMVPYIAIYAELTADGAVEVFYLDIG